MQSPGSPLQRAEQRAPRRSGPARALAASGLTLALALAGGCFTGDTGTPPTPEQLYFPTGLVVSPGRSTLYVVNSDFDLQFNGGTVQAIDLTTLRGRLLALAGDLDRGVASQTACADVGANVNPIAANPTISSGNQILNPGPCAPVLLTSFGPLPGVTGPRDLIRNAAGIGAFASGAVLLQRNDAPGAQGARLFVPVRGDPSVTFFDVTDDRDPAHPVPPALPAGCGAGAVQADAAYHDPSLFCLDCGNSPSDFRCDAAHRVGRDPFDNARRISLPVEPVGIAVSDDGEAIVVAHDTEKSVSLTVNRWSPRAPTLEFVETGVPDGPTEVASIPTPAVVAAARGTAAPIAYLPSFLVTYRSTAELDMYSFHDDQASVPPRPFISRVESIGIGVNADGHDSRGIAIDPSERKACEAACAAGATQHDCLKACTAVPLRLFVANRTPPSLLLGQVTTTVVDPPPKSGLGGSAFDAMVILGSVPLEVGPSRVAIGRVIGMDGRLHVRAFAVTFDSRFVFDYDPDAHQLETVIRTGRGPHALAFDTGTDAADGPGGHSLLFVAHFTDSYIGAVDLDMRRPSTFGNMIATLAVPVQPRETK